MWVYFEIGDERPVLVCSPEIGFIDDKTDELVATEQDIGRRPIAAFSNSDGTLQMLQWTTGCDRAHPGIVVRHSYAVRTWA
jgi:hypothetical protein